MGDLTANFSASEFNAAGYAWPAEYAANLLPLATLAQWIRDGVGSFGEITSAYRDASHNTDVGGSATSQHMDGQALDLVYPLASIQQIATFCLASIADGSAPAFGQLIVYPGDGHVHISLPTLGSRDGEVMYEQVAADGTKVYTPFSDPSELPGSTALPSIIPDVAADVAAGGWQTWAVAGLGVVGAFLVFRRPRREVHHA